MFCSQMWNATTLTQAPPRNIGVTNELIERANTINEPATAPGILRGMLMLQKMRQRPAPRMRAARTTSGSMFDSEL